jgi:hypothetical protein
MTPGEYKISVKSYHSLNMVDSVSIISGSNVHDFGELREGDVNNDNIVSIVDFSISATTFGLCEGAADYDERADLNGDNCVVLIDFSLLSSNFGQEGDELALSPFYNQIGLSELLWRRQEAQVAGSSRSRVPR